MAIDVNNANDVKEHGIMFSLDGNDKVWMGGGDSPPIHDAPLGSIHYQSNRTIWFKFAAGSGADKWSAGADHHASWDELVAGETINIRPRKQMQVHGKLKNCGTIRNEGKLVLG